MSNINQWLADLARLPDVGIEQWQACQHSQTSQTCGQADLGVHLRDLGEVSGWLTETGRVIQLREAIITLDNLPLAAELFRGHDHWQLTQLPRGQWQLSHHRLQPCATDTANCLAERVSHLLAGQREGHLHYWKLWMPNADGAPESRIALLTAIEEPRA